jgi:hypothetical protein
VNNMRRPFRRRETPEADSPPEEDFDAATEADSEGPPDIMVMVNADAEEPSQTRLVLRYRVLLAVLLLGAAGILIAAGVTDQLPPDLVERWPWLLIVVGGLGLLAGLVTAWPGATLGGPLVLGVGLVALLDQENALASTTMTLAGAALVALGLAVILRGLTMPHARG